MSPYHDHLSDRNDIQLGLESGKDFKKIGLVILKYYTTVSKEVKRNKQVRTTTYDNPPCPLLDKALLPILREGQTAAIKQYSNIENSTKKI